MNSKIKNINSAISEARKTSREFVDNLRNGNFDVASEKLDEANTAIASIRKETSFLKSTPKFFLRNEKICIENILMKTDYLTDLSNFLLSGIKNTGISSKGRTYKDLTPDNFLQFRDWLIKNENKIVALQEKGGVISESKCSVTEKQLVDADKSISNYLGVSQKVLSYTKPVMELMRLAGVPYERKYLFLIQNSQDLRPGGGLISVYGIAKFKGGELIGIKTDHVVKSLKRVFIKPNVPNPEPIKKYLRGDKNLIIYDANWSPDQDQWLSSVFSTWQLSGTDKQIDGIVVISTPFLEKIIDNYNGIEIPGVQEKFTSENLVLSLDYITEYSEKEKGKSPRYEVLGKVLEQIVQKMQSTDIMQLEKVTNTFVDGAKARDIYVYVPSVEEKQAIYDMGQPNLAVSKGDEVFVLDSGLGSGKADAVMKRSLSILVNAREQEKISSEVVVSYDFSNAKSDYRTYPYNGYLRVGLPLGVEETAMQGANSVTPDVTEEIGRKFFGNYVSVGLGGTQKVSLDYNQNSEIVNDMANGKYSLTLRKQSGLNMPFEVKIMLPGKMTFKAKVNGGIVYGDGKSEIIWRGTLDKDLQLQLAI